MRTAQRLGVGALVAAVSLHAGRAWAPFHQVVIDQVFFGTADCSNAQYVDMRELSAGMRFVNGQRVTTQSADGSPAADFGTFIALGTNTEVSINFLVTAVVNALGMCPAIPGIS